MNEKIKAIMETLEEIVGDSFIDEAEMIAKLFDALEVIGRVWGLEDQVQVAMEQFARKHGSVSYKEYSLE